MLERTLRVHDLFHHAVPKRPRDTETLGREEEEKGKVDERSPQGPLP